MINITIKELPNPYIEEFTTVNDLWGEFHIYFEENKRSKTVARTQWDVYPFICWIMENIKFLQSEELTYPDGVTIKDLTNITKQMDLLKEKEFNIPKNERSKEDDEYKWFDYLYKYTSHHNLHMGLMGSKLPGIFIGIINGRGTISGQNKSGKYWDYELDMVLFLKDILFQLLSILKNHEEDFSLKEEISPIQIELGNILSELGES